MKILNIYTQTVKIIQVWNGMPPVNDTKKVFLEGGGGGWTAVQRVSVSLLKTNIYIEQGHVKLIKSQI